MKTAIATVFTLLLFAACKEPARVTVVPTATVTGKLYYRSACQADLTTPNPFSPPAGGAADVGPYLYLSDASGKAISAQITTGRDGSFSIPGVAAGAYQLRISAQGLRNFWVGAPVATIPVTVSDTEAKTWSAVSVGVACADNEKPNVNGILATWGNAVTMQAGLGQTLHLEAASPHIQLDALGGDPDGDSLQAAFANKAGVLVSVSRLSALWLHAADVTSDSLRVLVTDGHGGNAALSLPVRLHQARILPNVKYQAYNFSDPATVASFAQILSFAADMTGASGWFQQDSGLLARLTGTSNQDNFLMLGSPAPFDLTAAVFAETNFKVVQESSNWMAVAAFRSPDNTWPLGFELIKNAGGFEWLLYTGQTVLGHEALADFTGQDITMRLEFDPSTGIATGHVQSESHGDVAISFPIDQMPAGQASLVVMAGSLSLDNETLELNFTGERIGTLSHEYTFPSRPGILGDLVYNQSKVEGQFGSFLVTNQSAYFGSETIDVTLDSPARMSKGLGYVDGLRFTVLTDMTVEEATAMGFSINSWDPDAVFPLAGNQGILY